ncbi:MAG: DUF1566 domain-containing protein [Deltaproteobacteria bacterium]|nr:DUF1566 domain-containing protein [Deltaproteobacteria bacterium]
MMVQKDMFRLTLCVSFLSAFLFAYPAFAEIKVFEKEVEEAVSRNQSQEQVEAFALQKAKRLAVEEAGTYISSLTVVQNYALAKDEITALASGVLQSQVLGVPSIAVKEGIVHVTVKAKIVVDTAVLNHQIEAFMRDKGALNERDEAVKKMREVEEKLANLKSTEIQRLEELNAQALALERDRDRQRLFREEQVLKAKGELSRAEADRIAKEREMSERINRTRAEQEKAKRAEAAALVAERDRIKRAQLENEQRWNDLARKAQLTQDQWIVIDDSLSLQQAMTEVNDLKQEIANLKGRLDYQYGKSTKNLSDAYAQQRALTTGQLPPEPPPKDIFETTRSYNERISTYERRVKETEIEMGEAEEYLKKEETLKLAEAKADYLGQQIRVLAPFIKRLQDLQDRKFTLPEGGSITIDLGEPDADNSRFPISLQYGNKSWSVWWNYTDVAIAKDFYRMRTYLKAEGLFQIEETAKLSPKLTAARVIHPGTQETREFALETPRILAEIDQFGVMKQGETAAKQESKKAEKMLSVKEIGKDGPLIAYDDGTVLDMRTNLMWAAQDNGSDINWHDAKHYCENYSGGVYTNWRMPSQVELSRLYNSSKIYRTTQWSNDVHLTKLIQLSACCPWASETRGSDAASFQFTGGSRFWHPQFIITNNRALPVRSRK